MRTLARMLGAAMQIVAIVQFVVSILRSDGRFESMPWLVAAVATGLFLQVLQETGGTEIGITGPRARWPWPQRLRSQTVARWSLFLLAFLALGFAAFSFVFAERWSTGPTRPPDHWYSFVRAPWQAWGVNAVALALFFQSWRLLRRRSMVWWTIQDLRLRVRLAGRSARISSVAVVSGIAGVLVMSSGEGIGSAQACSGIAVLLGAIALMEWVFTRIPLRSTSNEEISAHA